MNIIIIDRAATTSMRSLMNKPPMTQNLKLREKSQAVTNVTHASRGSPRQTRTAPIKYLNLEYFKLHPCPNPKSHIHKQCVYYHNIKDHKRYGDFYSDIMCKFVLANQQCPAGHQCPNAHSRVQQLYQYQSYKKKFCSHYPNNIDKCEYGEFCSFAHNEEQIRISLIHNYEFDDDFYIFHYKTEFCPFNLTEHDKSKCVYAHNLQDYRRNPAYHSYTPTSCINWNMKNMIFDYSSGCHNSIECNMCHGWKQIHYHPNVYKTMKCQVNDCQKGECPNYHSQAQRRIIPEEYINGIFKYVPRNRITKGTFKNPNSQPEFIHIQQSNSPTSSKSYSSIKQIDHEKHADRFSKTEAKDIKTDLETHESNGYHQYLLDQEVVESDDAEDWGEEENDSAVIGHVQWLILGE